MARCIVMRDTSALKRLCASMAEHLSGIMPALDSVPRIVIDPHLDCDGLSVPHEIRLNPRILDAPMPFLSLTLAHEVAHQWWGAFGQRTALPNEGMSELMAYHWLSHAYGAEAEQDAARIARGKMFHGFLGLGTATHEAEVMGRQVLVLRDARRLFGQQFWRAVRRVYAGDIPDWSWVQCLLDTLHAAYTLPVPALVAGRVVDTDATGLFAAVDLRNGKDGSQTVPFGTQCGDAWRIAAAQSGAVFDEHYGKDIDRYLTVVSA